MNVIKSAPERLRSSIRRNRERKLLNETMGRVNRLWFGRDWTPGKMLRIRVPSKWQGLNPTEHRIIETTCEPPCD